MNRISKIIHDKILKKLTIFFSSYLKLKIILADEIKCTIVRPNLSPVTDRTVFRLIYRTVFLSQA